MAAPLILTEASSGAPTLNGVNGSLTAVLRWALVQNGWDVEYGPSGNAAVFRAQTGNRRRLYVNHDSAVSGSAAMAVVRGCEEASGATTITDPFPTVAQVANSLSNWGVSIAANSTARRYKILLWPDFFYMFIEVNTGDNYWEPYWFGDPPGARGEDVYATVVSVRNNSSLPSSSSQKMGYQLPTSPLMLNIALTQVKVFWCRDIAGLTKSTLGVLAASGGFLGQPSTAFVQPALSGYGNRVEREKVAVSCTGSNLANNLGAMTQIRRAWLPSIWSAMHSGYSGISDGDVMSDSEYDAAASFTVLMLYTNTFMILVETTDTWEVPSG